MYRLYYNNLVRRLAFGLPTELWVVSVGIFLNSLGWAAVLPFEIIYLHDGRGFSLGDAAVSGATVRAQPPGSRLAPAQAHLARRAAA